jgi:segregation and condensation protein A
LLGPLIEPRVLQSPALRMVAHLSSAGTVRRRHVELLVQQEAISARKLRAPRRFGLARCAGGAGRTVMMRAMSIATTTEGYQLTLPAFEGPLDLLLHLIEREELDITEIALVAVTDQYMRYLHDGEQLNIDALADFIAIGARLLFLKSRALLPRPPSVGDDEAEEEDDGNDLARQLIEYRLFKEAAGQLRAIETAGLHSYPRVAPAPEFPPATGLDGVTLDLLQRIVEDVLTREQEEEPVQVIHPHKFTVREKIALIRELIAREGRASFRAIVEQCRTRMEVVVSFMAVLELVKSRAIDARQDAAFEDIALVPSEEVPLDVAVTSEFDE